MNHQFLHCNIFESPDHLQCDTVDNITWSSIISVDWINFEIWQPLVKFYTILSLFPWQAYFDQEVANAKEQNFMTEEWMTFIA